jgi:hypothetical protein
MDEEPYTFYSSALEDRKVSFTLQTPSLPKKEPIVPRRCSTQEILQCGFVNTLKIPAHPQFNVPILLYLLLRPSSNQNSSRVEVFHLYLSGKPAITTGVFLKIILKHKLSGSSRMVLLLYATQKNTKSSHASVRRRKNVDVVFTPKG